jgi:hypothetical protein
MKDRSPLINDFPIAEQLVEKTGLADRHQTAEAYA